MQLLHTIYCKSLSLCIYTDDTCTTDVLEVQYSMVHNWLTTLHILLSIKITVYNDILCTFSLKSIYTRLTSQYKDPISYHDIEFFITIFISIYVIYCTSLVDNTSLKRTLALYAKYQLQYNVTLTIRCFLIKLEVHGTVTHIHVY